MIRATRLFFAAALLTASLSFTACDRPEKQSTPTSNSAISIKLAHSAESAPFIRAAAEKFNALGQTLPDGTGVLVSLAPTDDLASSPSIATGEFFANLWLAPSSAWVTYAQQGAEGRDSTEQGSRSPRSSETIKMGDCASVFTTKLGVAYRFTDQFAVEEVDGSASLDQFLQAAKVQSDRTPLLLIGSPKQSASGMATLLAITGHASTTKLSALSPQSLQEHTAAIAQTQNLVRNYFVLDANTIEWLSQRGGGIPLVMFTTQQAHALFVKQHPEARLEFATLANPEYELDFPLCSIENKNSGSAQQQALRLVRGFLTSEHGRSLANELGYSGAPASPNSQFADSRGVTSSILKSWDSLRHASSSVFVVDASLRTSRPIIESIKREISQSFTSRKTPRDLVTLIAASTSSQVLAANASAPSEIDAAVSRLTTTGGNAIRDGILTAFDLISDLNSQSYRRSVIAFIASGDTSSKSELAQLLNRGNQLVGRRNVDLYVVAIDISPNQLGDIPKAVNAIGGSFVSTTLADLPATMAPIFRQIN